jgi:hypothetical protein
MGEEGCVMSDDLQDLRRGSIQDEFDDEEEAKEIAKKKAKEGPGFFGSMSSFERMILAILTLLVVIVFVVLILLATGRIQL